MPASANVQSSDFAKCSSTSFSAKAREFVPSFLKKAAQFTQYGSSSETSQYETSQYDPYMAQTQANQYSPYGTAQGMSAPAGNCMLISLAGYSDDSDSDSQSEKSEPTQPVVTSATEEKTSKVDPTTPNASTCEPDSDTCYLDSDDPEEQESDQEGSPNKHVECVLGFLQYRYAVDWLDGIDERLSAMEVSSDNAVQQSAKGSDKSPSANAGHARQPRHRPDGTVMPPRHDRGRKSGKSQQNKQQKKTSNTEKVISREEPEELHVSDGSWLAKQMAHRRAAGSEDEDVVRAMKSILNKLTIEKFAPLCEKLTSCGIRTTFHLETLINEVFEKATTQHHFINMYADLCALLHAHFVEHPIADDPTISFKKVLLNGCQAFFERHLKPPAGLGELDEEDRTALERKYKMQMLGNIKFVGALLVRQMLATKVMFAICDELITNPTPESLETLAALLTVVGPKFDIPEWSGRAMLAEIFNKVQQVLKQPKLNCRVKCLLKDVLELRASRWQDRKPKKVEGPSTLKQVADTQAAEEAASGASPKSKSRYQGKTSPSYGGHTEKAGGKRMTSFAPAFSPKSGASNDGYRRINSLAALRQGPAKGRQEQEAVEVRSGDHFDTDACRKEVSGALTELRTSHEVKEARLRICALAVPPAQQSEELCDMLGHMVEEGSTAVRKVFFLLVICLFTEGNWTSDALSKGLQDFLDDVYPDLKCDVPSLPKIIREELHPALAPLVSKGALPTSLHDRLAEVS